MLYEDSFLQRLESLLRAALVEWGLAADSALKLLPISENATWLVTHPRSGERVVMRVHRPDYSSEAEIRSELAWLEALRTAGTVNTAAPIRRRDGEYIGCLWDRGSARYVVAFTFVAGHEPDAGADLRHWYSELGRITAALHQHSRHWRKPAGFVRKHWDYDSMSGAGALWGDWRAAPGLTDTGRDIIAQTAEVVRQQLRDYGQDEARFGLVHCDLRLANLLVDGRRLTVIDFDDCGSCWYMYDFAAAVSFLEQDPRVADFKAAWLQGYRTQTPLSAADEGALTMFMMLRRIQLTAWINSHVETPTAQNLRPAAYTQGTVALAAHYLRETA
ncbi:Stress response kinase A [Sodalis praecaptivus]